MRRDQPDKPSSDRPGRVIVLANAAAGAGGRGRALDESINALRRVGHAVERLNDPGDLAPALAVGGPVRAVVAAGGDGTFNAALNLAPPGTPLVAFPLGTENLLAGYLRHTRRPADVVRLLREGRPLELDAGVANGRLFSLMASVGLDAEVVRRVHADRTAGGATRNITHLAYAAPILRTLGAYDHPRLRVTGEAADGSPVGPIEGTWLFAVNLPRYASGLPIARRACGRDGLLDLRLFRRGDAAAGVWYLWHVARGRHERLASVESLRVRRCVVEPIGEPGPWQIDGDPGGRVPLELSAAPRRMTVLVTRATARRIAPHHSATDSSWTTPIEAPPTAPTLRPPR